MRFKILGDVTAEHRRSKDKRRGRVRVPPEIRAQADQILETINLAPSASATMTIRELFNDYIAKKEPHRKPSTVKAWRDIWRRHLNHRIGDIPLLDFSRSQASCLWEAIHKDNPTFAKRTLEHIRWTVSGLYRYAQDRGLYPAFPGTSRDKTRPGGNPANAALPEGLRLGKSGPAYTMDDLNLMLTALQEAHNYLNRELEAIKREREALGENGKATEALAKQLGMLDGRAKSIEGRINRNLLAQAVLALAFGSGLRKGELQGLKWEDLVIQKDGSAKITVARAVWHGEVVLPKTEASAEPVELGADFVEYIEQYRQALGGVNSGFMFGYAQDRPIDLDSLCWWMLKPILNRCKHCKRPETAHGEESVFHPQRVTDHAFERDQSLPTWLGWHAFRRGNATHLAKNFVGTKGVQAAATMLRHADETVTQNHYIKESKQTRRARVAAQELERQQLKQDAAGVLGEGFRSARKQARIN